MEPENKRPKLLPTTKLRRNFSKIPIFIVDYHNEVLEFIYRCIGSRYLPFENNTIIHFDSHPDMVISRDIKASTIFNKDDLLEQLSIENWIMPLCYAGHFSKIVWIKNDWCKQIPIGVHNFQIGHNSMDEIQVDLPIDYFLSEGNYCENNTKLENTKNITLNVINSSNDNNTVNIHDEYILDIDLDFFSTTNPFLNIYEKIEAYTKLKDIFDYENSEDINDLCTKRREQLSLLEEIFQYLEKNRSLNDFKSSTENIKQIIKFNQIENLYKDLVENYDDTEIDWMVIYNAGCTSDNNGLPHHISSDEQIQEYLNNFENFLKVLTKPPIAITIARSSEDNYCPENQVDFIQENVLIVLKRIFTEQLNSDPILWYKDAEYNLRNL